MQQQIQESATKVTTIIAAPAGDNPDDLVLPDFKDPTSFKVSTDLAESIRIDITDWKEILFIQIINTELKKNLLQYRYGCRIGWSSHWYRG